MNNFEHFGIPTEKTISYTLELLTPYEKSLGTIPMVLNYSYKNKLIGLNEIDFDIPAYMIVEDKEIAHPFFHLIENGMIIRVTIVGQREPKQYIVDTANKSTDKSSEALKHIHAFSKEYFLSRKKFLGMELAGRILYYTPDLPPEYAEDGEGLARGVLNDIFTKYGITVSHIDETLKKKAREVSIGSGNIYQLISHLEEVFGCIFKFNGNATEVAIYDSSAFGRKTNITISERNIINSFSEDSRYEDMVTRMYVYGSDDVSIASVNPTGLPYIEDLTYFLKEQFLPAYLIDLYKEFIELPKNTSLLQAGIQERNALFQQITEAEFYLEVVRDELRQATHWAEALQLREKNDSTAIGSDPQYSDETAWNSLKKSTDVLAFIDAVRKNTTITDRVFTANNISFVSLLELSRSANEELTNLFKDNLEALQARGGEAGWLAEITRLNNALKAKENEIKSLQQNNDFDNYMKQKLTTEQLIESRKAIEAITIEGEYINSDLDSSMLNELLTEGEKALAKACFPKIQFQVEALDFSQLLDTEDLWNYLTLGDTVFIKSDTGFNYPVYFIGIEHSPESASLNLQFSSAAAMTDSAIFLADLIASATRANGILALNKENWNEAAEGTTLIKAQLQQGFDLAKQQLDGASKQQPILDERGFWLYALDANGNPKPEQIRAVNNVIALTKDGWETVNVAITPEGINADTIVVGTLSADRVRLGRFESIDKSTFWDLETNEIKIGDNFHFSPSTGLQINLEEEPKHKNLISTAGFFIEQSVILPYGATHRFETNPSTGELSLITPKESGTYIFYIASDSATLTQDFTLLNNNLATYGEGTPVIKYALASTQFDLYSEEVAHIPAQKIYTLKPNETTIINPLGFLQVSITKDTTTSETTVRIPAESLALVKNNIANLTWEDTEISGISSSVTITNNQISAIIENDLSDKLTELNLTDEGIQTRVQSVTNNYFAENAEKFQGQDFTWNLFYGGKILDKTQWTVLDAEILNINGEEIEFLQPQGINEILGFYDLSSKLSVLETNKKYTISFDATNLDDTTAIKFNFLGFIDSESQVVQALETKQLVFHLTRNDMPEIQLCSFGNTIGDTAKFTVQNLKVEEGTVSKPFYTPHMQEIYGVIYSMEAPTDVTQIWFDINNASFKYFDGTEWINVTDSEVMAKLEALDMEVTTNMVNFDILSSKIQGQVEKVTVLEGQIETSTSEITLLSDEYTIKFKSIQTDIDSNAEEIKQITGVITSSTDEDGQVYTEWIASGEKNKVKVASNGISMISNGDIVFNVNDGVAQATSLYVSEEIGFGNHTAQKYGTEFTIWNHVS